MILALDIATTTGWCVGRKKPKAWGHLTLEYPTSIDYLDRFNYNITRVVIEDVYKLNVRTLRKLAMMHGWIQVWLWNSYGISYENITYVEPRKWQSMFKNPPKEKKARKNMYIKYAEKIVKSKLTSDEADAILIHRWSTGVKNET